MLRELLTTRRGARRWPCHVLQFCHELEKPPQFLTDLLEPSDPDENEDPVVEAELRTLYTSMSNLMGGRKAPYVPNDDENTSFVEYQDVPESQANPLEASTPDVKYQTLIYILAPVQRQRALDALFPSGKKTAQCPVCIKLTERYADIVLYNFTKKNLDRHLETEHTSWKEVVRAMRIPEKRKAFKCPTVACHFKASTLRATIKHCIGEDDDHPCINSEMYAQLQLQHVAQYEASRGKLKEENASSILQALRTEEAAWRREFREVTLAFLEPLRERCPSGYLVAEEGLAELAKTIVNARDD